jgi:hypothetical protein
MAKQRRITIETDTLLVLKGKSSVRAWCARCGADAETVELDAAVVMSNLKSSETQETDKN